MGRGKSSAEAPQARARGKPAEKPAEKGAKMRQAKRAAPAAAKKSKQGESAAAVGSSAERLTNKQEAFCAAYVETGSQLEAYRRAYNAEKMKPATVQRRAYDVFHNGKVAARIEKLKSIARANEDGTAIITAREMRRLLADIARGVADVNTTDMFGRPMLRKPTGSEQLKALNTLIKMGVDDGEKQLNINIIVDEGGKKQT